MNKIDKAVDTRERQIYNSSLAERQEIMGQQNHRCAICERPFVMGLWKGELKKFTAFHDHDHQCCPRRLKRFCGKCNRGYLCFTCNKYVVGVIEKQNIPVDRLKAYLDFWTPLLQQRGADKNGKEKKAPARKKAKLRRKQKSVRPDHGVLPRHKQLQHRPGSNGSPATV